MSLSKPKSSPSAPVEEVKLPFRLVYSGISGAIATTIIYPLDIIKTKLMDQKGVGKIKYYSGPLDCFIKTWRADGE